MISIAEAISDLLYVRDTVVVPGLGAFIKKPVPAKVNPVANHFAMPGSSIEFDPNLREDNDLVVNYLSEKNAIPVEEAQRLLAMFVSDSFNSLKAGKKLTLNGIGVLYYDWADDLILEPDKTVNYNSDAFGLSDFTLEPVLRNKTKAEIKEEIEKQQKDKNTPVTVDERAVHEHDNEDNEDDEDDDNGPRLGWLWILLGLLLAAGVVFGLYKYGIITFPWEKEEPRQAFEPGRYTLPVYEWNWERQEPVIQDTIPEQVNEPEQTVASEQTTEPEQTIQPEQNIQPEPIAEPEPEAKILIIAGCFVQEEYAAAMANTLKGEGYQTAFYEKRGSRWYVSFGRYHTDEEALAMLQQIRANTEYEVWILK